MFYLLSIKSLVPNVFFSVKLTASAIVKIIRRTDTSALCHSFFQGWNPPHRFPEGISPFLVTPIFLKQILKITPSFWGCMQIVWKTLKWRSYISYYTKSIKNIIIITLYTFRLNSVFTTDSLVRYCL